MPVQAQGAIIRQAGTATAIEAFVVDDPGPGEVLVRILASGVCHSDLHVKLGNMGTDFPYLLGHEGTGVVERAGEGVASPKVGDLVILARRAPCGHCRFCRIGQYNFCAATVVAQPRMHAQRDGAQLHPVLGVGTFCTHTVVAASQAVKIDSDLSPDATCLIACAVMTGVGAVLYTANVRLGSTVAVFGCGGVGINVIQGAKLAHASRIIAVDVEDRKLAWARSFGATDTINARQEDPIQGIKDLIGGHGADYTFEAIGKPETLEQALLSRDLAGTCVLIGVPGPTATLTLPLARFFNLGGSLRVSWFGDCLPSRDFPLLADWYRKGDLKLDELVTRRITLDQVDSAFHAMERGETLRSVIVFPR